MTEVHTKHYIGIDVSKKTLDIYDPRDSKHYQIGNTVSEIASLVVALGELEHCHFVLEASGGYEKRALYFLVDNDLIASLVDPRRVKAFARASGCRAKTDKLDAKLLSKFGEAHEPRPYEKNELTVMYIAALEKRILQVTQIIVDEKNRKEKQHAELSEFALIQEEIDAGVEFYERQKAKLQKRIDTLISSDKSLTRKSQVMQSFPGVGVGTTRLLIGILPEIGKGISRKQLSALVGLAPYNHDSGAKQGARFIQGGRKDVRCGLYMATLSATQYNPVIKDFYERLKSKGKPKMKCLTACARKLICILNQMVENDTCWDPEYAVKHGLVASTDGAKLTAALKT